MIRATEHIPGFADGCEPRRVIATDTAALLSASWVARYVDGYADHVFYRWSLSRDGHRLPMLMAEFDDGQWWWCVARLDADTPIALPEFRALRVTLR